MPLQIDSLHHVHTTNTKITAQCPACAATGGDKHGNHLSILPDGRFTCVTHPGLEGKAHRQEIFRLVGYTVDKPFPSNVHIRTARTCRPIIAEQLDRIIKKSSVIGAPISRAMLEQMKRKPL